MSVDLEPATHAAALLHAHLVGLGGDVALEHRAGQMRYARART
ncbi:MAG TPA: hypothetical protein VM582_00770 [Candidatus Thermoplasmatota archaeon]|nr:hypothetical protein [Candidatus Thermoplasmatota archaeon]